MAGTYHACYRPILKIIDMKSIWGKYWNTVYRKSTPNQLEYKIVLVVVDIVGVGQRNRDLSRDQSNFTIINWTHVYIA